MIERYSRPEMKRVWSEESKFNYWLNVEIAVCEAWRQLGVIPDEAMLKIRQATCNTERMAEILKVTHHDMTAFLRSISEGVGEEARFIHLGLTSSDIMDTALSIQLKAAADILLRDINETISALKHKAIEHKYTIMMGRTHGVHAEPITFGLKLAIWWQEMKRHLERMEQAKETINVGKISGAVGTFATVPMEVEQIACEKLALKPAPVSNQIIQRDRHAQFITTLALIGSSLEKFATEIRGLQRTETLEAEEPFETGQTGSSAMPHKRNPELCERVCGLSRLLRGYALTSMENISLWHERDISHSSAERVIFPDACLVLDYMLSIFLKILQGLQVYPEKMRKNLDITKGLVFSQRVMLSLIEKGMTREKAYDIVQRNAMISWKTGDNFFALLQKDNEVIKVLPESSLAGLFDYNYFIRNVDKVFYRLGIES